jgi:hypothetical protein
MAPNNDNASYLQPPREGLMKLLTISAITLSVLGFANGAQAQGAKLFFEGDVIRGNQAGAPGPACVLNNQFKRLEKVVFRFRILDQDGKPLDASGIKSLFVEVPGGNTKLQAAYGPHPGGNNPATDHFWTAAWIIPDGHPAGTFSYKATVTDLQGNTLTWEPFKRVTSQFQVADASVTVTPPPAKK